MISIDKVRKLAMGFEGVEELPHFEKTSFRIQGRIFLTLDQQGRRACLRLMPEDQDVFGLAFPEVVAPVPNAWGRQGWTFIDLQKVQTAVFEEILVAAYETVKLRKNAKRKKS